MNRVWAWMILAVVLVLGVACGPNPGERRATEAANDAAAAWSACDSAGYAFSGSKVAGKYFFVRQEFTDSSLKPRSDTRARTLYRAPSGLAERLQEAKAVLCAKTTGQVVQTCSYRDPNGQEYTIARAKIETSVILLAWPSGELVARGTLLGSDPPPCPRTSSHPAGETHGTSYGHVDIGDWLQAYWSAE